MMMHDKADMPAEPDPTPPFMRELSPRSLRRKEDESINVIRMAVAGCRRPALLWSLGKDSTAMLHLVRKAFLGAVPMPVIHIDTGQKFPEMYVFRDRMAEQWKLDLRIACNRQAIDAGTRCCMDEAMTCCQRLKTDALKQIVQAEGYDALLVGIRRDEHGIRAKERYFSPRDPGFAWDYRHQPVELPGIAPALDVLGNLPSQAANENCHFRVHPLLHWSELDIWSFTRQEKLPIVPLYLARNGQRYRSLGCQPATRPVPSEADTIDAIIDELCRTNRSERGGRAQDKESAYRMERLRSLGYL